MGNPVFYGNYLTHPEDMETLIKGIQFWSMTVPGCEEYEDLSVEYIKCAISHISLTGFHYTGTAKMGPPSDPESVVNHQLKVYGVGNLRVVDNSIMPTIVSGNTNAAAIMIGEKASDMIKEDCLSSATKEPWPRKVSEPTYWSY